MLLIVFLFAVERYRCVGLEFGMYLQFTNKSFRVV
jgi:hypothetical protein